MKAITIQISFTEEAYAKMLDRCKVSNIATPEEFILDAVHAKIHGIDYYAGEKSNEDRCNEVATFDLKDIHEGACHILKLGKGKVCVCKEKGLIKLFEIELEE